MENGRKSILSTKTATPLKIDEDRTRESRRAIVLTFFAPVVAVSALLFLLITYRGGIEAGVSNIAHLLPLGYAFAAGLVATANPCGILLLPSYVFFQLNAGGDRASTGRRLARGLVVATVVTIGFILVFALVGNIVAAGGQWLVTAFPFIGLLISAGMVGLGMWMLVSNKTINLLNAGRVTVDPKRSLGNAFLFGVTYALGSLSCTLPIFLVVIGTSLTGGDVLSSFGQFVGYALGMGSIIYFVTIGSALFRRAMGRWMRLVAPHIHRVSAIFLLGAGSYLIYYWLFIAGIA